MTNLKRVHPTTDFSETCQKLDLAKRRRARRHRLPSRLHQPPGNPDQALARRIDGQSYTFECVRAQERRHILATKDHDSGSLLAVYSEPSLGNVELLKGAVGQFRSAAFLGFQTKTTQDGTRNYRESRAVSTNASTCSKRLPRGSPISIGTLKTPTAYTSTG